jgi:hypothetical protein
VRLEELPSGGVAHVPVAAQERAREVLLEQPDRLAAVVEHVVAPAELEHRLGLDHEEVGVVVRRRPEPDVLLDLQLLLAHVQHRLALLRRAGRGHADPVFVGDRPEDLLDQEPIRAVQEGEDALGVGGFDAHLAIFAGGSARVSHR